MFCKFMKKHILIIALLLAGMQLCAQEIRLPEEPKPLKYKDFSIENSGVWYAVEIAAASSVVLNHKNTRRSMLTFTIGYRLNEFIRAGVGLGVNCYFNGNADVRGDVNKYTMPVYFNLRGNFLSQDVRSIVPYWSLDGGANLGDGYFVSSTFGIRIGQNRSSFLFGLNYAVGDIDTHYAEVYKNPIHFLGFKLGYEF